MFGVPDGQFCVVIVAVTSVAERNVMWRSQRVLLYGRSAQFRLESEDSL
jgi:hypothetical protein